VTGNTLLLRNSTYMSISVWIGLKHLLQAFNLLSVLYGLGRLVWPGESVGGIVEIKRAVSKKGRKGVGIYICDKGSITSRLKRYKYASPFYELHIT